MSLFGQGCFGAGTFFETNPIGFEDSDGVWAAALPHINEFLQWSYSEWKRFHSK